MTLLCLPSERLESRGNALLEALRLELGGDHHLFHETAHVLAFALGHLELGEAA